jgi:hypothetical protein
MNNGYKKWIEDNLSIVNKEGSLVPFKLNPIQDRYLTEDTSNRKDYILKARQMGFSSLILAIFTADFLLKENVYNVVVADNADNAQGLLKRVKDYLRCIDPNIDKLLKYNSKYELYLEKYNNTYKIGTAENINFGRSKTITNLHLSELSFFPHLAEFIAGAVQAVVPSGRIIIETTSNGFNESRDFWYRSELGETGFKTLFYPASKFYSKEFLDKKRGELGRLYIQEYPETAEESFVTSGTCFFSLESLKVYLDNSIEPIKEGVMYE